MYILVTLKYAENLVDLIEQKLGVKPYLISMNVHRSQIDANRGNLEVACMGCKNCFATYQAYHHQVQKLAKT